MSLFIAHGLKYWFGLFLNILWPNGPIHPLNSCSNDYVRFMTSRWNFTFVVFFVSLLEMMPFLSQRKIFPIVSFVKALVILLCLVVRWAFNDMSKKFPNGIFLRGIVASWVMKRDETLKSYFALSRQRGSFWFPLQTCFKE